MILDSFAGDLFSRFQGQPGMGPTGGVSGGLSSFRPTPLLGMLMGPMGGGGGMGPAGVGAANPGSGPANGMVHLGQAAGIGNGTRQKKGQAAAAEEDEEEEEEGSEKQARRR